MAKKSDELKRTIEDVEALITESLQDFIGIVKTPAVIREIRARLETVLLGSGLHIEMKPDPEDAACLKILVTDKKPVERRPHIMLGTPEVMTYEKPKRKKAPKKSLEPLEPDFLSELEKL